MAASHISEDIVGVVATAPIAQWQAVQASGAPAVAAGNALGFATIAAATGVRVPVAVGITAIAVAGGAIALGAPVEVGTTVTQVVTRSAGIPIGRAMNATSNAGDQVEIFVIPN